jgi:hypothetical protein
VWINGPFGGGKTQTSHEIQRRLPDSVICDPEEVGFGLLRMTPSPLRHDFQDQPSWRQGVFEVLARVLSEHDGVGGRVVQLLAGKDAPLRGETFAVSKLDLCPCTA